METITQHQKQFQYAEAYVSDMLVLKNIFLETQNLKQVDQNFGLPFLLAKTEKETVAFLPVLSSTKRMKYLLKSMIKTE